MAPEPPRQNSAGGMAVRVAIEDNLTSVRQAVEARGWQAVPLAHLAQGSVDAIVCTGQERNMFGNETVRTQVPIIDADGLTAEEVLRRLENEPRRGRA